jgi:phenylacetate-CoA ligase
MSLLYQDQTQWLDGDHRRVLFAHAARTVPFYGERFAAVLRRGEIAAGDAVLATADLPASHGKRYGIETSGTGGRPVSLFGTEVTGAFWRAGVMREHLWHDRRLDGKLAAIRRAPPGAAMAPLGLNSASWGPASGSVYPTGPAVLLNVASALPAQLDWLLREDPDYLISLPSNLIGLAKLCLARGVRLPRLAQVMAVGEPVTPELRAAVREAWGVPVKDSYSCEEAGYLAIQCPLHEVLHVQSENVLLEIVDDAGRPCRPGEAGRVLVTSLHNFATPLIRYDLGDLAEAGAPCACGRGLPVIARVLGRATAEG